MAARAFQFMQDDANELLANCRRRAARNDDPSPRPKAKAKAKAKGKALAAPTEDAAPAADGKTTRTDEELGKFCHHWNHNNGKCPFGDKCKYLHEYVKKDEKKRIPKPRRSPSEISSRGQSTDAKGKGKGRGKGKDPPQSAQERGRQRKPNLYCGKFLKTGKCDKGANCPDHHIDNDKYEMLKGVFGDNLEGYFKKQ